MYDTEQLSAQTHKKCQQWATASAGAPDQLGEAAIAPATVERPVVSAATDVEVAMPAATPASDVQVARIPAA